MREQNKLEAAFYEKTGLNFNQFYQKNFNKLVWQIKKLKIDTLDAEGLANDSFMRSLEKIDMYDTSWQFTTWLFTIARNISLEHKKNSAKLILVDCVSESDNDDTTNNQNKALQNILNKNIADTYQEDTEIQHIQHLKYQEVLKQISLLKPSFKTIIEMRDIQGKSYQEISDTLGEQLHKDPKLQFRTVCNRLHHGRGIIEKNVKERFEQIDKMY